MPRRPVHCTWREKLHIVFFIFGGPGSSVGIATDYGLDDPGSNPGEDEIFPPVQIGPEAADHSPPSSAAVMEE